MAHFYGVIQGSRGSVSRGGTKNSGMTASVNGWNVGARIEVYHDSETGLDTITVIKTSGSNGGNSEIIATYTEGEK